jgi:hypothetical protein
LARSTASATYIQPEPGTEFRGIHLIGATTGGTEDRWRDVLFTGAETGGVTAIAVSDPRQVRPENRLDDQRWQQAARHVAGVVDPHVSWVAFRTRPDAVVVFMAKASHAAPVALPQLAAVATTVLHHGGGRARARPPVAAASGSSTPRTGEAGRWSARHTGGTQRLPQPPTSPSRTRPA